MRKIFIAAGIIGAALASQALAANMTSVTLKSDSAKYSCPTASTCKTVLSAEYALTSVGPQHECELQYTTASWKTYETVRMKFSRTEGTKEYWKGSVSIPARILNWEYQVTCTDRGASRKQWIEGFGWQNSRGVTLSAALRALNTVF